MKNILDKLALMARCSTIALFFLGNSLSRKLRLGPGMLSELASFVALKVRGRESPLTPTASHPPRPSGYVSRPQAEPREWG